jgi:hypothetical protein
VRMTSLVQLLRALDRVTPTHWSSGFVPSDERTVGPSDERTVVPSDERTLGPSDERTVGQRRF